MCGTTTAVTEIRGSRSPADVSKADGERMGMLCGKDWVAGLFFFGLFFLLVGCGRRRRWDSRARFVCELGHQTQQGPCPRARCPLLDAETKCPKEERVMLRECTWPSGLMVVAPLTCQACQVSRRCDSIHRSTLFKGLFADSHCTDSWMQLWRKGPVTRATQRQLGMS